MEDIQWSHIRNYTDLYEQVKDFRYIFIDEIQDVDMWERAVRSLQTTGIHDVYITGSNSQLLSSELSTYLSGRYVSFYVYPLTYPEFLQFHNLSDERSSLLQYMQFGGLPYLKNLTLESEIVYTYLRDVVNTIVLKDVVSRYKIRNVDFFKRLIQYLARETGSIFSAKSISDYLKSQKIRMSPNTVLDYIDRSISASFLHKASRYDIKGKRFFELREKYYFTDIGIKNVLLGGYATMHISGILENIVYMHLVANGWSVSVGELGTKEIDFIAQKNTTTIYVQVAYLLETQKTREREQGSLLDISDSWKKYIVTLDQDVSSVSEGIEWMSMEHFLMTTR